MADVKEIRQKLRNYLDESIEDAEIDWIICYVTNKSRSELFSNFDLTKKEVAEINKIAKRRSSGKPLSQVLGECEFYGLNFKINKNVLIPRFETELLVETIIKVQKSGRGLDIGTGSGEIAITLNKLQNMDMVATDISKKALALAKKNNKLNRTSVEYKLANIFDGIGDDLFDFIVSNPPYIPTRDIEGLQVEVKNFEPHLALDGGTDGLDFYKKIIEKAPVYLSKKGRIFFEIGIGQGESVSKLLQKDFKNIVVKKDYAGIDRIVYAERQ